MGKNQPFFRILIHYHASDVTDEARGGYLDDGVQDVLHVTGVLGRGLVDLSEQLHQGRRVLLCNKISSRIVWDS